MWWAKAKEADGIIVASPTHVASVPTEVMSFLHRIGMMAEKDHVFHNKVATPIVAYRRGGALGVYETVCRHFYSLYIHSLTQSFLHNRIDI